MTVNGWPDLIRSGNTRKEMMRMSTIHIDEKNKTIMGVQFGSNAAFNAGMELWADQLYDDSTSTTAALKKLAASQAN